jgi:peptidyl-prolyl cis-trans isomerase C
MSTTTYCESGIAKINGVALKKEDEKLTDDELRQRACSELLRQAAIASGLLAANDRPGADGVISENASEAIEILLESKLVIPEPEHEACHRHYLAHRASHTTGERVKVRHILFAVTDGVDVAALRNRAETTLLNVRCHDENAADVFAEAARTQSNCPSGANGGNLDWLTEADCAPEFAREIFAHAEVGVLPRLVHSRFGLHVVEVQEREAGVEQPFESVSSAIAMTLRRKAYVNALLQYLRILSNGANVEGVDLEMEQVQSFA